MVEFVEHFWSYLARSKFLIQISHASLHWLVNFHQLDNMLIHWITQLQQFDKLVHRAGKDQRNAGALSCMVRGVRKLP